MLPTALETHLARNYGGKRGWMSYVTSRAQWHLGRWRRLGTVDWSLVNRLVFVCTGNICRSPFAHRAALARGLRASSFGLDATTGSSANDVAQRIAAEKDIRLGPHRATAVCDFEVLKGDLLLGFEPLHAYRLLELRDLHADTQVTMVGIWGKPVVLHTFDPYGLSEDYFRVCFSRIEAGLDGIMSLASRAREKEVATQDVVQT